MLLASCGHSHTPFPQATQTTHQAWHTIGVLQLWLCTNLHRSQDGFSRLCAQLFTCCLCGETLTPTSPIEWLAMRGGKKSHQHGVAQYGYGNMIGTPLRPKDPSGTPSLVSGPGRGQGDWPQLASCASCFVRRTKCPYLLERLKGKVFTKNCYQQMMVVIVKNILIVTGVQLWKGIIRRFSTFFHWRFLNRHWMTLAWISTLADGCRIHLWIPSKFCNSIILQLVELH